MRGVFLFSLPPVVTSVSSGSPSRSVSLGNQHRKKNLIFPLGFITWYLFFDRWFWGGGGVCFVLGIFFPSSPAHHTHIVMVCLIFSGVVRYSDIEGQRPCKLHRLCCKVILSLTIFLLFSPALMFIREVLFFVFFWKGLKDQQYQIHGCFSMVASTARAPRLTFTSCYFVITLT